MNNFKYKSNNEHIREKLKVVINKIKANYNNGKIKTKTDYLISISESIYNIYSNINKPTMKVIEAKTVPSKNDVINMSVYTLNDLYSVLVGCSSISNNFYNIQDNLSRDLNILSDKVVGSLSCINSISKSISEIKNKDIITFVNNFDKVDNLAEKEIKDKKKIAVCDMSTKRLTLPIIKTNAFSNDIDIEILNTSNGFPGNTHEIYNSSNIRYIGKDNPRISLVNIKTNDDYNISSADFFEFEMFNVSEETLKETGNIGFKYKEGVSWISDENELKLDIKIKFKVPTTANYFSITAPPIFLNDIKAPIIKKITIVDSFSQTETININKSFDEFVVINFKERVVDEIFINISQSESYSTIACRKYGLAIDPKNISKFLDNNDYIKIERPIDSINYLNLKYNNRTKSIIYPTTKDKDNFLDKEFVKSKLFTEILSGEDFIQTEKVYVDRYSIGIRSIAISSREYEKQGIYISEIYDVGSNIKTIVFSADDYVPHYFKDYKNAIKYFISFGSNEWIRIYPKENPNLGPCCIEINNDTMIQNRNKNIIYLDSIVEITKMQIKIELEREIEERFLTPTVTRYSLDINI